MAETVGRVMAKETEITVDVCVTVPDKTVIRCLKILEMWMDDNPDRNIVCDLIPCRDGVRRRLRIETLKKVVDE